MQVIVEDADFCGELVSVVVTMLTVPPGTGGAIANATDKMPPEVVTGVGERVGTIGGTVCGFTAIDALYGGVPPTMTNWNVLPAHADAVAVAGLIVRAGDTGGVAAAFPTSLVSNGDEPPGMVRPVASVIANCMLTKQAPLVVAVKLPPLTRTTLFESDTTPGKVAATV